MEAWTGSERRTTPTVSGSSPLHGRQSFFMLCKGDSEVTGKSWRTKVNLNACVYGFSNIQISLSSSCTLAFASAFMNVVSVYFDLIQVTWVCNTAIH